MKLLLLCLCLFTSLLGAEQSAARPNILFLLSDDQSYPFLSCYGDTNVKTPAIDRIAAGGMKFHRFFTAAPQCVPSRAAFMTGRSPVAARITRFSSPLARDEITFPEILRKEAGYFVGVCGRSYHLDGSAKHAGAEIGEIFRENGMLTFRDRFDFVKVGSDDEALTQTAEFLDARPTDSPFFLWVNFSDPHHPWTAPVKFRPDPATLKLPDHWPDLPGMREQLADHCAEINRVDTRVEAVLGMLADRKLDKNTIIVFAGDNGVALPRGKGSLHDPGCNVPFVVSWPGVVRNGSESRDLISAEDLGPTLLEAAGLKAPERMSGKSFLPLLKGEPYTPREHVFTERGPHGSAPVTVDMSSGGYDLSRAVRSNRYKLIYNATPWIPYAPVDSAGGAAWRQIRQAHGASKLTPGLDAAYFTTPRPVYELYDLDADPSELENLSGKTSLAAIEKELRLALVEKMIVDFDYLPLPAIPSAGKTKKGDGENRNERFKILDTDKDGKLSPAEFGTGRKPEEAREWFSRRDADRDGSISLKEFTGPLGK